MISAAYSISRHNHFDNESQYGISTLNNIRSMMTEISFGHTTVTYGTLRSRTFGYTPP
jgi:hypothetical protein